MRRSLFLLLALSMAGAAHAQTRRLVVVKVDGLPQATVERFVNERDPRTGKSRLPWISHVFYERGTRLRNFYTRGLSLSGPSWSLLNTGRHLQIKGNVEFDRLTLRSYDYLNFFPFYLANARSQREDMPAVEVLDQLGIPMLLDLFPRDERYQSIQLFQRGVPWNTLNRAWQDHIKSRAPRELLSEWAAGFELRGLLSEQLERELIERLADPQVRYLDLYLTNYDHVAHHNRDAASHLWALQEIDAAIGRIWTAIERSPLADDTALVLVSDHGTNTDEEVYSQGFNLVTLLGSEAGGGHHVITKRRLLTDYSLKALYPFTPLVITPSSSATYLKGRSNDYPTAVLDFDGNERASLHLRDSDLNLLHILFVELRRKDLSPALRRAAIDAVFATLNRRRDEWKRLVEELEEEIGALRRVAAAASTEIEARRRELKDAARSSGDIKDLRRASAQVALMREEAEAYERYARALSSLLALTPRDFEGRMPRLESLIPTRSVGLHNTIHQLQNYIAGLGPQGLVLDGEGRLDLRKSFRRIDYFALLAEARVRNNVQLRLGNRPIDFVAVRVPKERLAGVLDETEMPDEDAVWLYASEEKQALVLARNDIFDGQRLRYMPIRRLRESEDGRVQFERAQWEAGLPLKLWEDKEMQIAADARAAWLNDWHSEVEWLRATHRTLYSNAVIGLHEHFARHDAEIFNAGAPGLSEDEQILRRFRARQRWLAETDLLILANNHWNFDVRGVNPGGNHGSFFRVSTHATLMFAGGKNTGIRRGAAIDEPYDSLSFIPSVLTLIGYTPNAVVRPANWLNTPANFASRPFPGRVIRELFEEGAGMPAASAGER